MVIMLAASLAACGSGDDAKSEESSNENAATTATDTSDGYALAQKDEAARANTEVPSVDQTASGIADTAAQAEFHRQVIYTADLHMQVKDFAGTRNAIDQLITKSGGYLLSSTENASSDRLSGSFSIKVPAKGFNTFIDAINKLPDKKLDKSIKGEDVTEEYADLTARLKAKEVAEKRLLSFMENAANSKDLVAFSNELAKVQEEIEQIKGRMRFIDQNVDYSTINIEMYQTLSGQDGSEMDLDEKKGLMTKASNALHKSADMIVTLGRALVIIAAFLLPILPIIIIVGLIIFYIKRRKRRAKPVTVITPQQNDPTPPANDNLE